MSCEEALLVPASKQAMDEEMDALVSRRTWDLFRHLHILLLWDVAGSIL